jgi:hypothetical protein
VRWRKGKPESNGSGELVHEARRLGYQLTAMGDRLDVFQERLRMEVDRLQRLAEKRPPPRGS